MQEATGDDALARTRLLTILARVQLAAGRKEAAATSQEQIDALRAQIAASLSPAEARGWRRQQERCDARVQGMPGDGRVCVWLPRRDAPSQQQAVVWTLHMDSGDEPASPTAG